MTMNRVQFQPGLSLPEFYRQFGTEEQCTEALEQARWPEGFRCPHCQSVAHYVLRSRPRKTFQCAACRRQTSLIAGILFEHTHLPLTVWFLAIYLVSEAKTGLSALALKRQLGGSYPPAWLLHHKLMQTMSERDALDTLRGTVPVDEAYLGGERLGQRQPESGWLGHFRWLGLLPCGDKGGLLAPGLRGRREKAQKAARIPRGQYGTVKSQDELGRHLSLLCL